MGQISVGANTQAYELVSRLSFFAPTHVWLRSRFIDMARVPEIKVNGEVVYSTAQPGTGRIDRPKGSEARRLWHLLNDEERRLFTALDSNGQSMLLHMARKRTPHGTARFKPVSVEVRLR